MSPTEAAWLAGIIDGEGTIALSRHHANEQRSPVLSVASTSYEILDKCRTITNSGIITRKRISKPNHSKSWAWRVNGGVAIELLHQCMPALTEPEKARRARLLVYEFEGTVSRNGRYTPEQLTRKAQFEQTFFQHSRKVVK